MIDTMETEINRIIPEISLKCGVSDGCQVFYNPSNKSFSTVTGDIKLVYITQAAGTDTMMIRKCIAYALLHLKQDLDKK